MRTAFLISTLLAASPLAATALHAETLTEALAGAYQSNPALQQQRAVLRQLDETYVQARTGLRPTLSLGASGSYTHYQSPNISQGNFDTNSGQLGLNASQTLFTSGRTTANIRAAQATIEAGRETLRSAEAQVLTSAITAYIDVRRDAAILSIRRDNIEVLKAQLDETSAKYQVGQVTPTDVSQARAQYAQAKALFATADGQLRASRASYAAVIGQNPADLAAEPDLPGIPATIDAAFDVAARANPDVASAEATERASQAKVAMAKTGYGPQVSANASVGTVGPVTPLRTSQYGEEVTAGLTITQPLYSGGLISSDVRQALEQNNIDRFGVEKARREMVRQVSSAWSAMVSARADLSASMESRDAAKLAYDGTHEEYRAGLRTTLDVLLAEQTLRDAEIALTNARHDAYQASAQLLAAIGLLDARNLALPVETYDPKRSFDRVRNAGATPLDRAAEAVDGLMSRP